MIAETNPDKQGISATIAAGGVLLFVKVVRVRTGGLPFQYECQRRGAENIETINDWVRMESAKKKTRERKKRAMSRKQKYTRGK